MLYALSLDGSATLIPEYCVESESFFTGRHFMAVSDLVCLRIDIYKNLIKLLSHETDERTPLC